MKTIQESLIVLDQRDILDWLDALKYDDEYEKHLSLHLNGTCEWIIRHPLFSDWESDQTSDTGARFLWIHGPAGFGKTVLSAWLIRYSKETLKLPVACCFSSSHAQRTEDFDSIVRTWITQLAQNSIEILNHCQMIRREHSGRRASRGVIWSLLKRILSQTPSCILALDGLDEFRDVNETRGLFLEELKKAVASTRVRILITSRNDPDIEAQLRASATQPKVYTMLECKISTGDVKGDLGLYSHDVVGKRFFKQDENYRNSLSAQLAEKADGMFLWIKLQQSQLRGSQNRKTVQRIVEEMPLGLDQTYEGNWKSIQKLPELDRNRALDILRWLTFGIRPLTVQELVEALIIEIDENSEVFCEDDLPADIDVEYVNNEIKGLCRSFIDIRDETGKSPLRMNTVHLAHGSVREYLITILPVPLRAGPYPNQDIKVAAHHAMLASHCLRYLNHDGAWDTSEDRKYRSFTTYAVHCCFEHVQKSSVDHQDYGGVSGLLHQFLRSDNVYFRNWKKQYERIDGGDKDDDDEEEDEEEDKEEDEKGEEDDGNDHESEATTPQDKPSAVYYACLFSLNPTVELLLDVEDEDFNSVGGPIGTPLQLACLGGLKSIFELLIRHGADSTVRGGPLGTAINAAASTGHSSIVRSLLEREDSTAQARSRILEAVNTAASGGYLEIVESLLDGGANAFSEPESDQEKLTCLSESLYAAAVPGHLLVVKLLLERGANIDHHSQFMDETPLHGAVEQHHLEVVVELVERGANVALRDKEGYTPLHAAAFSSSTEIAAFLLSHGADLHAKIDPGLDAPFNAFNGFNALHLATFRNHLDFVNLLLEKNAKVDISGPHGWRAIHIAARKGFVDVLLRLIHGGADVNGQDDYAKTPLYYAALNGQNAAAEILLQYGADVNARGENGETPMHAVLLSDDAINDQQRLTMFQLLVDHDADPNMSDIYEETPLFKAVRYRHIDITGYLISKEVCNINAKNKWEQTALHVAIKPAPEHDLTIIQLLIDHGADPCMSDVNGETPLFDAVRNRDPHILRYLISKEGCNINAKNKLGQTPLHGAIDHAPDEYLEALLLGGADLSAMDQYGMTCLDWIKRSRPRLLGAEILRQQLNDVVMERDVTIIRCKAIERTKRLASTSKADLKPSDTFYKLCTHLLLLDMELDALLAYQLDFLFKKDDPDRVTVCNGCSNHWTRDDPFYKCKVCPETDLCDQCMAKYKEQPLLDYCQGHEFFRAIVSEARITLDQPEEVQRWFLEIQRKIESAETDEIEQGKPSS